MSTTAVECILFHVWVLHVLLVGFGSPVHDEASWGDFPSAHLHPIYAHDAWMEHAEQSGDLSRRRPERWAGEHARFGLPTKPVSTRFPL